MKTQHTPGPWSTGSLYSGVVYAPKEKSPIAICDGTGFRGATKNEANARLIAAAPELLEMLVLAERAIFELTRHNLIEKGCPRGHTASQKATEDQFVIDLRAAIAKAEGRA